MDIFSLHRWNGPREEGRRLAKQHLAAYRGRPLEAVMQNLEKRARLVSDERRQYNFEEAKQHFINYVRRKGTVKQVLILDIWCASQEKRDA